MAITEATQRRDFSPTPEPFTPVASKRKRSEWKPTKILLNQLKFIGPGIVAAVAYCDPGNWATDLEAGSTFGYAHLFVILSASIMAIILQVLATRLGYITGKALQNTLLRPPFTYTLVALACLYPLYALCEAGIIFTDLAELLGSAIALKMLFPRLPLWVGVLLTSTDVFIVLAFFNSYPEISSRSRRSMHIFEFSIAVLVLVVLVSFIVLIVIIVGATVMPHSIFLGSKVAISDRLKPLPIDDKETQLDASPLHRGSPNHHSPSQQSSCLPPIQTANREDHKPSPIHVSSVEHCKAHLAHATFDVAISLFTLALPINAAILIVAAGRFLLHGVGRPLAGSGYIFAIALLVAGQAASITVTLAGQIVSEGFIAWHTRPVVRRLVTRLIGILPSAIVAASVGPKGVDDLLVGSQVALSLVLPFVVLPLIIFTSDAQTMTMAHYDAVPSSSPMGSPTLNSTRPSKPSSGNETDDPLAADFPRTHYETTFENNLATRIVVGLIFCICCVANVYAIVQLAQGRD
ncbi:hypothetical protein PCANC_02142 [Puccinia coronata f. sp. avenae]|uniref:Amino acid transporter transmembrane domain-containing protein n=1 Tax=Puccinia coronata f. sp. avenae TaxID=200324 RepID=A0A2N5VZW3_9BASI|nr:hypothetical protein PCANC_02142 [Puccinia coronata f. sp. avenae]